MTSITGAQYAQPGPLEARRGDPGSSVSRPGPAGPRGASRDRLPAEGSGGASGSSVGPRLGSGFGDVWNHQPGCCVSSVPARDYRGH